MFKEFKEFISRGNIVDMAVGVIIGGAFQKIVNSLVNDIIMPFTSIFTGKIDYTDWVIIVGNSSIKIGSFLTTIINFLIIALSIFLAVRYANKINKKLEKMKLEEFQKLAGKIDKKGRFQKKKKEEPKPEPTTKICPFCYSEISIKATRCPHCTSLLENLDGKIENKVEKKLAKKGNMKNMKNTKN